MVFLIVHEIILFGDFHDSINRAGLATSIITNFLSFPIVHVFYEMILESVKTIITKCKSLIGEDGCILDDNDHDTINVRIERSNHEQDKQFQSNDCDTISIESVSSTLSDLEKFQSGLEYIGEQYKDLTTAWSPLFFLSILTESIIVINAGFVLSKQLQSTQYMTPYELIELILMVYFIIYSILSIIALCYWTQETHRSLTRCISLIR